ncbi:MAG TPA: sigma-54 dependent transcriptional regulator [Candidatus Dormibacteraeota bacterium]|nr:sigma-54 dependent transcriptional regulator [Candidatus Dormibacteraeota bacterium]
MTAPASGSAADETTILIVDDEPRVLDALEAILAAEFRVLRAGHGEEALERLAAEPDVAVIVTDHRMPGMTGVELLRRCQERTPDAVRIVLTAYTDVDSLMEAINTGRIYHFVPKPWDPNELLVVVRRAAERWRLARENARLRDELELAYNALRREAAAGREKPASFDKLVGAETGLRRAVELARKVLDGDTSVLLLGETGTGKELFAHLIHANGSRRTRPFVAQSCGALPDTLLESELFGHARGAFTGAVGERKGLFEEADGGTIFLDEVGETSPAMQLRLLRVLQEGEVRRVGGSGTRRVDVRLIAATNADLEADVAAGRFRRDLYYRLSVFPVRLPPLRERAEDIPTLAEHFLRQACRRARRAVPAVGAEALSLLRGYPWPGNVRELENEIERALALADDGRPLGPAHLSERIAAGAGATPSVRTLNEAVEALKRRMIEDALRECGSKTRAAEQLGLTRQSLQQMLRRRQ